MSSPDNQRTPLGQLMEPRPRHQVGDGSRPFAYCDPALRFANTERTPLGAIMFPQSLDQMRIMLERIGFLRVAQDDDIVAPPADDADEIRRDHISDGVAGWQAEQHQMEPLLCQFLWNTMWTWIARRPGKAVRVDMVTILVDKPHEVTGRVQVSARMRISTARDTVATEAKRYLRRGETGALVDEE